MGLKENLASSVFTATRVLRRLIVNQALERSEVNVQSRAEMFGLNQKADWSSLKPLLGDQKSAFMLGGGPSIDGLSSRQFEFMGKSLTVSHEWWPTRHSFIPNVIFVETTSAKSWSGIEAIADDPHLKSIYATRLKTSHDNAQDWHEISPKLRTKAFYYVAVPHLGVTLRAYEDFLRRAANIASNRIGVATPNTTSLERIIFSLAMAGSREIVLCGYDLGGQYFAQRSPKGRHYRERAYILRPALTARLSVLQHVLADACGVRISLGTPSQRLSEHFGLYEGWQ